MTDQTAILKISTALSNKPYFVKISSPDQSIDTIFREAVSSLSNTGRIEICLFYGNESTEGRRGLMPLHDAPTKFIPDQYFEWCENCCNGDCKGCSAHREPCMFKMEWCLLQPRFFEYIRCLTHKCLDCIRVDHRFTEKGLEVAKFTDDKYCDKMILESDA